MKRSSNVVAFIGPSLTSAEAKRVLKADYRPPARQGDVWRAMRAQPRAIVLIDGVFEAQPSVWHHELRSAMDAGIAVFGASSMGALRAAELREHGMIGVGAIYKKFASGEWNDDSHVALLQGPEELGFRPMTVPWVNVWHNAQRAVKAKVMSRAAANLFCTKAAAVPYQQRTWRRLEREAPKGWAQFVTNGLEDLKALDALACLSRVAKFMSSAPVEVPRPTSLSAFARHRWMTAAYAEALHGEAVLEAVDRFVLADYARLRGLAPDPAEVAQHEYELLRRGADASNARRWAEVLTLEAMVRAQPTHVSSGAFVPTEAAVLAHFLAL